MARQLNTLGPDCYKDWGDSAIVNKEDANVQKNVYLGFHYLLHYHFYPTTFFQIMTYNWHLYNLT